MSEEPWARWGGLVACASGRAELAAALDTIAAEMRAEEGPRWNVLGVQVRRRRLSGRLGGIVHRSGHRVVLVEERLGPDEASFVAAHEVAHMVLSYSQAVIYDEETLCDAFAEKVLGARRPRLLATHG
jgi:hypothetical protein